MAQKQPSWRCGRCHVIMKGSFPRCWKCGQEWQACVDHSFVPPDHQGQGHQHAYNSQTGQPPPWNGATWQDSGSRSPRTRSRRNTGKSKKHGKHNQNDAWQMDTHHQSKGYGKGYEQSTHMQGPMMPMSPMMPMPQMMMQYPQQQVMAAPYPVPPPDKGSGKGSAASSTMTMPSPPPTAITGPPGQWAPTMQMMPVPAVPAGPGTIDEAAEEIKKESKAQANLNRLLKQMKKDEESLTSDLQKMAHTMQKQDERDNTKELGVAVKVLGQAKEDLIEAEGAKAQLLSQWKTFLQQSVVKWREFSAQFQASESAHQASIQAARLNVRKAQRRFDLISKREQAQSGDTIPISDEEEESEEMVDATADQQDPGAQRIHEGMTTIVNSLVELSASADLLEQRVKRPRTEKEDGLGDGGPGGGASFH